MCLLDAVIGEKASFSCESLEGIGMTSCCLSISQMVITGESIERLFLWGHSACTLENAKILLFGGFGGNGRHARKNDSFLVDPLHETLREVNVVGCPSPRLGHTSSLVGDCMFVIGGRADPLNILSDVWVLNTVKNEWKLLDCTGCAFPPRSYSSNFYAFLVDPPLYLF